MLNNHELKLRVLIYGMTNCIVLTDTNELQNVVETVDMVRNNLKLTSYIFRPSFAVSKELTDYSSADWAAIYAQYSITYGWTDIFESIVGTYPSAVLAEYELAKEETPTATNIIETVNASEFTVKPYSHLEVILKTIAESKTVLRKQQLDIIELMPIEILEKVYNELNDTNGFVIKETEVVFIQRLLSTPSINFNFNDADQVVRVLALCYRSNGEGLGGQLNKIMLKDVKLKVPTTIRKKIWNSLNNMPLTDTAVKMYKYQNFWKVIFKQIAFASLDTMKRRYAKAFSLRDNLYTEKVSRKNKALEMYKADGKYAEALLIECNNPGQMLRNLLQYLRYTKRMTVVRKTAYGKQRKQNNNKIMIQTDIIDIFNSKELLKVFVNALDSANVKLLWNTYDLITKGAKAFKPVSIKKVFKTQVTYHTELPGIHKSVAKTIRKLIKASIKKRKRADNVDVGKVFIHPDVMNYPVQQSGRKDTSITLSGEYLYKGAKIQLETIIANKGISEPLLRLGIAWKGATSCDVDLSARISHSETSQKRVYYGNPVLEDSNNEIIATSSGDITSCCNSTFSAEFIDIDLDKLQKEGYKTLLQVANMFSGSVFSSYEAYWFMQVIDKKDRIVPRSTSFTIDMNVMDYAVQITDDTKVMVGLYYNVTAKEFTVLNTSLDTITGTGLNIDNLDDQTLEEHGLIINSKYAMTLDKALRLSIAKDQRTDDMNEADIIISPIEITLPKDSTQTVIHPGRDNTSIQKLIM